MREMHSGMGNNEIGKIEIGVSDKEELVKAFSRFQNEFDQSGNEEKIGLKFDAVVKLLNKLDLSVDDLNPKELGVEARFVNTFQKMFDLRSAHKNIREVKESNADLIKAFARLQEEYTNGADEDKIKLRLKTIVKLLEDKGLSTDDLTSTQLGLDATAVRVFQHLYKHTEVPAEFGNQTIH